MVKAVFSVVIIAILYMFYSDGLKPYFNALSETHRLLNKAGIPIEKSTREKYRVKAIQTLETECEHGFYKINDYDFRCASNATFSIFR